MRDRATWNEAKKRALAAAEAAGVTDGRAIVRQAWGEYLEIVSGSSTTPKVSPATSRKTSALAPLQISPEQLRTWQERNRSQASEVELAAAASLLPPEQKCGLCDGARFVRDADFKPGKVTVPVLGVATGIFPGAIPCPECNARSSVEVLLARSYVPVSLRGLRFDAAERRDGKRQAIEELEAWAQCPTQSLCLHGLPGVGKTHLAIASVLACCEAGLRAEFWPFQSLLREMQLRFGSEDDSAQAFEERISRVPVLVLDDVGAEQKSQSGWSTEVFERMLDARLNAALPTLITTNLAPADLAKHVEARAASRLRLFRFVAISGVDMRAEIGRRMAEVR